MNYFISKPYPAIRFHFQSDLFCFSLSELTVSWSRAGVGTVLGHVVAVDALHFYQLLALLRVLSVDDVVEQPKRYVIRFRFELPSAVKNLVFTIISAVRCL